LVQFEDVFNEIAFILLVAAVLAAFGLALRQPVIIAFLAAGILIGPSVLGVLESHEEVELLAGMGIALLLFVVGLKLDLHTIKTMGRIALATGMGQVIFTSVFGFLIALAFGLSPVTAVYVAVALTFSSTVIIVKLLTDKREIDSLHGRIAVGFLIVQDIVVVIAMITLSAFAPGAGEDRSALFTVLEVAGKAAALLVGLALVTRFVLPWLLGRIARSQELLAIFAIAWAVAMAAAADLLGFSREVGAFLGGVSLATTEYRDAIASRLTVVRDFLLLFFFLDLGVRLDLSLIGAQVPQALVFSVFVLVGNPLIVLIIMGLMGYRSRTSFLAGLTVAQISEFSLILVALGVSLGHIGGETLGLVTLVGLVTITLSTYMILYSEPLHRRLAPALKLFQRKVPYAEAGKEAPLEAGIDVILIGLGRYGGEIANHLLNRGRTLLGVDFDPEVVTTWSQHEVPVVYGDALDPDIFQRLPLTGARWVVNTTPGFESNLAPLRLLQEQQFTGRTALTAHHEDEAAAFMAAGADAILRPFSDAAAEAADILTGAMDLVPEGLVRAAQLREFRLPPSSGAAGLTIGELSLREQTGTSILAVSRKGRMTFAPPPEFRLFPGDHLLLLAAHDQLERAVWVLEQPAPGSESSDTGKHDFSAGSLLLTGDHPWVGHTIASLDLRRVLGVTVVQVERDGRVIVSPPPNETLKEGDTVLLAGNAHTMKQLDCAIQPVASN
jgi:Kef-type K+ transport system membrane component KefB/Trk K+ transport system NAD-binding subunit